jgi:hypothetical protein
MKTLFSLSFAVLAFCFSVHGQLTLREGESFSYYTNWSNTPPGFSGSWQNGALFVNLAPASVQSNDAVLVEVFNGLVEGQPVSSETFSNTTAFHTTSPGFTWWGRQAGFRITALSGSVTITECFGSVAIGPFFGPANYYMFDFVPSPRLRLSAENSSLQLRWPTNATGYFLETSTDLLAGSWDRVAAVHSVVEDEFVVTTRPTLPSQFFRLSHR